MNYTKIANRLKKYIESNGKEISIIRITKTGDDWNPTQTEDTPIDIIGIQSQFAKNEIDGSLILQSDKKYIVSGDIEIKIADKIRDNDNDYSIVNVVDISPGGESVINILQVRK